MNEEELNKLADLAKKICDEQYKICTKSNFRGYIDKVLFKLLKKYNITLEDFYKGYALIECPNNYYQDKRNCGNAHNCNPKICKENRIKVALSTKGDN